MQQDVGLGLAGNEAAARTEAPSWAVCLLAEPHAEQVTLRPAVETDPKVVFEHMAATSTG